ncbi:MAG: hypothetical protein HQ553_00760 [Chloroflexi bacterium]|nr:hypothetical protein [Chloroflexota bacterium]
MSSYGDNEYISRDEWNVSAQNPQHQKESRFPAMSRVEMIYPLEGLRRIDDSKVEKAREICESASL